MCNPYIAQIFWNYFYFSRILLHFFLADILSHVVIFSTLQVLPKIASKKHHKARKWTNRQDSKTPRSRKNRRIETTIKQKLHRTQRIAHGLQMLCIKKNVQPHTTAIKRKIIISRNVWNSYSEITRDQRGVSRQASKQAKNGVIKWATDVIVN